jgi:hypothetical protein
MTSLEDYIVQMNGLNLHRRSSQNLRSINRTRNGRFTGSIGTDQVTISPFSTVSRS